MTADFCSVPQVYLYLFLLNRCDTVAAPATLILFSVMERGRSRILDFSRPRSRLVVVLQPMSGSFWSALLLQHFSSCCCCCFSAFWCSGVHVRVSSLISHLQAYVVLLLLLLLLLLFWRFSDPFTTFYHLINRSLPPYQHIISWLSGDSKQFVIVVDWTSFGSLQWRIFCQIVDRTQIDLILELVKKKLSKSRLLHW